MCVPRYFPTDMCTEANQNKVLSSTVWSGSQLFDTRLPTVGRSDLKC